MANFLRFEDIIAWQKARVLCQIIKPLTEREGFSRDFKYITQQEFEDIHTRALEISKILHGLIVRIQSSS